ncbi:MAG: GNAT family N-acetyltransferase [Rubrivivax sp.]
MNDDDADADVLQPLTSAAYDDFLRRAVDAYAAECVAAGRWRADEAPALALAETQRLLPDGLATPGHALFTIHARAACETAVGYLWFGTLPRGAHSVAFVYQVIVLPAFRRQGHARRALQAAERLAHRIGHASMVLHVFAHNAGAQALYRSLGYEVSSLNLVKRLDAGVAGRGGGVS